MIKPDRINKETGIKEQVMEKTVFTKLDKQEKATALAALNDSVAGAPFVPEKTNILEKPLPFYPAHSLLEITDQTDPAEKKAFAVYKEGETAAVLDSTNHPIYQLNQTVPLKLNRENVAAYCRFFLDHVRGRHGGFLLTETIDDIKWKDEPPSGTRKAIGSLLCPLGVLGEGADGYELEATLLYRDALFKAAITISPTGQVAMKNKELILEDMPVPDTIFAA